MILLEIRGPDEARRYLAQGLWLQRVRRPRAATVVPALRRALELASGGEPLPPTGFIADVGHLVFDAGHGPDHRDQPAVPGWPEGLARAYEDLVLGRLDADGSIARAADALGRYRGRDRDRGLVFLLEQVRRRAGFGGVQINPAVIKTMLELATEEIMTTAWEALARDGPMPILHELYEELIAAVRDAADALGPEDVFELEHGTALAAFGQRVALRQVLRAAADFEAGQSPTPPRRAARRHDVATHWVDEDTYPVGGFSSISTRGSIESLLHSQLAYMEPDERPDLFDIKYVRDELLYYARDENQFLRRRRSYLIALDPGLVRARVKDADLPYQRIVLLLALLVAAVRTLTNWLSEEALVFEFLFLDGPDGPLLDAEREVVEMILREAIANGTALTDRISIAELPARGKARSRRSLCHCLIVAPADRPIGAEGMSVARLRLSGPRPALAIDDETPTVPDADDAPAAWRALLDRLLAAWA